MHTTKAVPFAVATALVASVAISAGPGLTAEKSATATETLTMDNSGWSSEKSERLALNLGQLLVLRMERAKQLLDQGDVSGAQAAMEIGARPPTAGPSRRTFSRRGPSRRTFARRGPSRRTFGWRGPSRRTLGRWSPSRRTLGRFSPSRRSFGRRGMP